MKLLIVGLGSIGSRHAGNAAPLDGVEAAVFDVDPGLAEAAGSRLGVQSFCSWRAALEWRPEAAVVAVPTSMHLALASELMDSGAHVLVEKPISDSLDGVDAFLDKADALGRKVFVVCNMRFHPAIKAVRESLPRIGRPLFARAHYGNYLPDMRPGADYRKLYCAQKSMGGGVVLDAIHELDYLTWFFGSMSVVSCETGKLSDLDIDVEDYASLLIRHAGGVRSETHLDYLRRCKRRGLEVVGEEGGVIWLSEGKNPESCVVRLHTVQNGWETVLADESLDATPMYAELMRRFVAALGTDDDNGLLTGREARNELAAVLAAHRSGIEGRVVHIEEIDV